MSIQIELRLEGPEANEDTLLDLIDWLERADIEGVQFQRKELPSVPGEMGGGFDQQGFIFFITTAPATIYYIGHIWHYIEGWLEARCKNVSINPTLIHSDGQDEEAQKQIQTKLREMQAKSQAIKEKCGNC
jgi:hypothetical protein